ncbi:endosialidase chaperone [Streptococcus sp. CM6]|uniref:tail fiber domain-containing protein n=1 Tax=Streptococcus sp. CM6 TaxID=936580 RepID=UPI00044833B9|nr:tail fiber domain-containing protein [Streptococcus sp. CM6]EUC81416.1 endosialidase chaperone [Streptococcus sp. CM6]
MDIFRRKKFDEAMFAKDRTLSIRVGQYQSSNIKEASFDYGYIKGDTYKPGGTCAGSAKIVFTSIITTFNKLDKVYPEIGLLVDGTYEWVKMGEYFINDIEIDRNRKTTTLDLMDGMFKLNREHITSLTYPAEIRQVIKEICLKTGVELANENMDITSMNYRIESIPKEKKMTFRDVLSLATQMLGMSCFFNREGKLEIKELTDSGIVITADSYFMHGLTKSEVEYRIAGITCKKDKEILTVGMRTGRSLELDNLFMSQAILDNLYHKIKDIRYYSFNLNYQGHLLLNVGEWVTIKTNTGETFKSPVLSQSFTFKGGLRGRISADSKAGNDAQYSYAGTLTKKIEQFSEFEKQIQNQIEEADKGFDKKVDKIKNDFNDQIELAKAKAEEVKQSLTETIDQRFSSFNNGPLQEVKRRAEEALRNAGASSSLAQEAKRISEQATADITKLKNEVVDGYVGKNTYQEGIRGIERRIEEVKTSTNGQIATQIAAYKQSVDGRFTSLSSQIDSKANLVDFQRVQETSKLYERIIGSNENDISNKVARMALTNQLFQVEVGKYANTGGPNMLRNSRMDDGLKYWEGENLKQWSHSFYFNEQKHMFMLLQKSWLKSPRFLLKRNTSYKLNFFGFNSGNTKYLKIVLRKRKKGEKQDYTAEEILFNESSWPILNTSQAVHKSLTFDTKDFDEGYLYIENGGPNNGADKWSGVFLTEFDLYEGTTDRKWQPAPEDATMETDKTLEATQTKMTQLAGSWAIQNLTSAGSIISQINATNNQILIEAEKIRLKGKTLLDELTAIDGYFKRLFVGEGAFAKLNAEIIGSKTITADKLIMDSAMARLFVSSDIFTDTLASKAAFITKLRSVVVSATLFEGYKGKIGGFQIGTHDKDPSTYWLTGQNQFAVGMSNGSTKWGQTSLWVNWGNDWEKPGDYAWFVKRTGEMFCYNRAYFWNTPVINGNLRVTGEIYYNNENSGKSGYWIYSPQYKQIFSENGYMYFVWSGGGSNWIPMNKEISDRRYKSNIQDSQVSGIDVIKNLKTYSYRKEYDGKIEDISCGIMAQDVQKYVPEAFYKNPDGAYSYRTFELVPYLIKAIQELNQKIEKLEKTA